MYTYTKNNSVVLVGNLFDDIWIKTKNSGPIDAYTPKSVDYYTSLSTYEIFPAKKRFIKFQIKACSNAFVLLSSAFNLQSPDFYEICIGGSSNTKIYLHIRRFSSDISEYQFDVPGLLSCSEHKTFIVNWEVSGRITLTAETGIVLDWTDTSPIPIQGVGFMTGWGSDGKWILKHSSLFTGYYCGVTGFYGNMTLLSTRIDNSVIDCALECALGDDCLGINFHHKTKECQFVAGSRPVVKFAAHDWKFYTKCLKGKTMFMSFKQSKLETFFGKTTRRREDSEESTQPSLSDAPSTSILTNIQSTSSSSVIFFPFHHKEDQIKFIDKTLLEDERKLILEHKWVPDNKFEYLLNDKGRRDRCGESEFFSVMVDETADVAEKAQLSICVRYVNKERDRYQVNEDFLGFVEVERTDTETLCNAVLHNLGQEWGFDLTKLRGQGYDGCAIMTAAISGVQKRIQDA
ncbi:unnamed protein product [Mytilus coruscus]|uniref:DUF4371 domain-containing protein n=1 Tax=Mytilus coruscus TaxID=42192 RepID=A0A6J8CZ69_MYTCO|nr:unnamed protein product [Mytilus coruscus]